MRASDIRKLTVQEVEQRLQEAREELWRLKFRSATEDLENPLLIRTRRKDVAKMECILQEHRTNIRRLAVREDEGAET
jgi:large subunit ribosomal protein L29